MATNRAYTVANSSKPTGPIVPSPICVQSQVTQYIYKKQETGLGTRKIFKRLLHREKDMACCRGFIDNPSRDGFSKHLPCPSKALAPDCKSHPEFSSISTNFFLRISKCSKEVVYSATILWMFSHHSDFVFILSLFVVRASQIIQLRKKK